MAVKPILCAVAALLCLIARASAAESCAEAGPDLAIVRLGGLDAAGDPVLTDGQTLRLVGIAPRQDAAETARFAAGIAPWRERDLRLVPAGEPDRWGRRPVRLLAPADQPGAEPRDLAEMLIAAGAATRLPEAAHAGCGLPERPKPQRPAAARATPANPRPAPEGVVDGHDVAALKAQAGRLVAVEGRIASVGERAQRTYLNFSRRRAEAGAIVMSRRLWRQMQEAGWTTSTLEGKRIRALGILSGQDGTLLEVTSASALELID